MLLTGALQNCQQVPCESAVPSARACKRAGSWFCWITPPWLCRARGAVKSRCSGCVDGEGSWGVEGCAVLTALGLRPLGSSPGMEAGARSREFVSCVVLLGLSSAQPHPNTAAFITKRSWGLWLMSPGVFKPFTAGEQGFFFPRGQQQPGLYGAYGFRTKQLSCWSHAAGAIGRSTWSVTQLLGLSVGAVLGVIAALAAVLHTPGWRAGNWAGAAARVPWDPTITSSREAFAFPLILQKVRQGERLKEILSWDFSLSWSLSVPGHCKVVPFLVTNLCSPRKTVLTYLCTDDNMLRSPFGTHKSPKPMHSCASGFAWTCELLENVFPVSKASRKVSAFVFSLRDCPYETGMLHQGTPSFPRG